jgi:hypothetical protein
MCDTDHNGNFLAATNQVICRVSEPKMAEALAVRWVLKFICDQHFKKVVIASDCLNLVRKLLQKSLDRSHIGAIIQDIRIMKNNFDDISFVFVSRNCNEVIHVQTAGLMSK